MEMDEERRIKKLIIDKDYIMEVLQGGGHLMVEGGLPPGTRIMTMFSDFSLPHSIILYVWNKTFPIVERGKKPEEIMLEWGKKFD